MFTRSEFYFMFFNLLGLSDFSGPELSFSPIVSLLADNATLYGRPNVNYVSLNLGNFPMIM